MEIWITIEQGYILAMQSAEQGGLFSGINFRRDFPTKEIWFNSLPEWRKNGFTDSTEQEKLKAFKKDFELYDRQLNAFSADDANAAGDYTQ